MVDLSFEEYLDPDYYKEIMFDFFPKFGGVGRDSKYRHFGLKMVNCTQFEFTTSFKGHRGLVGREWFRRLYKKGKLKN